MDMVRIGGCRVGTVTTLGTITAKDRVSVDAYMVTFDNGTSRRFKIDQAVAVLDRCSERPAYETDYCPSCGTAAVIGGR